jgi:hypothetical protein
MTIDELIDMRANLVAALGQGSAEVETPQLGRVSYRTPAEIQSALAWLDAELQQINPTSRTFVIQSNRGTGV